MPRSDSKTEVIEKLKTLANHTEKVHEAEELSLESDESPKK